MRDRLLATIQKNAREELRVSVGEYRGARLFKIRTWFKNSAGEPKPTRQGVVLRLEKLPLLAAVVAEAIEAARSEAA